VKLEGVYQVDSCGRSHDLGKWNISCNISAHATIVQWLDDHLVEIWNQIPLELPEYADVPVPERLSARRRSFNTVSSGLTNASPVSHFLQSRAARHANTKQIETVIHNPWKPTPPVQSVAYTFNKEEPPLPSNNGAITSQPENVTMTAAGTATSAVSTLAGFRYAASVQLSVDRKIEAFEEARESTDFEFTARMNDIEDKLQGLQDQLAAMAATVTTSVLAGLQKPGCIFLQTGREDRLVLRKTTVNPPDGGNRAWHDSSPIPLPVRSWQSGGKETETGLLDTTVRSPVHLNGYFGNPTDHSTCFHSFWATQFANAINTGT
jgi:hypothetical protein